MLSKLKFTLFVDIKKGKKMDRKVSELFQEAFHMHQAGDLGGAKRIYAEILELNPVHFDALHLSGLIAAQNGLLELAIDLMSRALQLKSNDAVANNNLGIVYYEVQDYAKAIELYRRALAANPVYSDAFYNLGNVFFAIGSFDEAVSAYENAIRIEPRHINAYLNLGIANQQIGKYELAVSSYDSALQIKPDNADAFFNRALANYEMGCLDLALLDLERAIIFDPLHGDAAKFKTKILKENSQ